MAAAIKGGVKFAVGTDGMHGGLAKELEYLTEFGASTEEALMAATISSAKVCGLAAHIGTLEPGKASDIVGVEGNPLKDIQALKRVKTVIHKGKIKRMGHKKKEPLPRNPGGKVKKEVLRTMNEKNDNFQGYGFL
jgi:imidazolonepropionase-like amidohydrolase